MTDRLKDGGGLSPLMAHSSSVARALTIPRATWRRCHKVSVSRRHSARNAWLGDTQLISGRKASVRACVLLGNSRLSGHRPALAVQPANSTGTRTQPHRAWTAPLEHGPAPWGPHQQSARPAPATDQFLQSDRRRRICVWSNSTQATDCHHAARLSGRRRSSASNT